MWGASVARVVDGCPGHLGLLGLFCFLKTLHGGVYGLFNIIIFLLNRPMNSFSSVRIRQIIELPLFECPDLAG